MFFDAHNHLADVRLRPFREQIFERCAKWGIHSMAVNGTHPHDWEVVAALPEQAKSYGITIYPQFGLHPWKSNEPLPANWLEELQEYLSLPRSGIGEVGLDRWKRGLNQERMQAVFLAQLELASAQNLPLSIHCLKAWGLLLPLLQEHALPQRGFLLHGYGGDYSIAKQLLEIHGKSYFSFSGYALHERKQGLRECFQKLPIEQILLESDAPDMLPPECARIHSLSQADSPAIELNSPANLSEVYAQAPFLPSAKQLEENGKTFFSIKFCNQD